MRIPQLYSTGVVRQDNGVSTAWRICAMNVRHYPRQTCCCSEMGNRGTLLMPGTDACPKFPGDDAVEYLDMIMSNMLANPVRIEKFIWLGSSHLGRTSIDAMGRASIAPPNWLGFVMDDCEMPPLEHDPIMHCCEIKCPINWNRFMEQPTSLEQMSRSLGYTEMWMPDAPAWVRREQQPYFQQIYTMYDPGRPARGRPEFSWCMCGHRWWRENGRDRYDGYDAGVDPHKLAHDHVRERRMRGPERGLMITS